MSNENKIATYLKGVKQEWGKITWPEWMQVRSETIFVLIIVTFFTLVVLLYDWVFNGVLQIFQK